jgi:hypothetical protein
MNKSPNQIELYKQSERLRFSLALVLGTAIYLWTDEPLPGVLLSSLQAGWNSLLTGWWLWRVDAVRPRAHACLWFHLATACWQAAAGALISLLTMMFAEAALGQPVRLDHLAMIMIVLSSGVLGAMLLGMVAAMLALRTGHRIWCHPHLRRRVLEYQVGGYYVLLPSSVPPRAFNHAIFVLATSCVAPVILAGVTVLIAVSGEIENPPLGPILAGFGLIAIGPLVMIAVYVWLSHRVIAQTAEECWPDGVIATFRPAHLPLATGHGAHHESTSRQPTEVRVD